MKRLCYVSGYYDPRTMQTPLDVIDRAATWRELAREQVKAGFETHVVTLFLADYDFAHQGVEWHFVAPSRPWAGLGKVIAWANHNNEVSYYQLATRLTRVVRALSPDLVHFFGLTVDLNLWLIARQSEKLGIPLVLHYHGGFPARHPLRRKLQKINLRRAVRVLFTSRHQAKPWLEQQILDSAHKVAECMETSTTFAALAKAKARRQTQIFGHPVFVCAGRLHPLKDPLTVLRGFEAVTAALPGARLYFYYTTDELLAELQRFVRERPALTGKVMFGGRQPHVAMPAILSSADFLLQASTAEFSGLAVLEAMACGAIPVVTDIIPFRVMTEEGRFGILFPPGNWRALAQAILSIRLDELPVRSHAVQQKFQRDWSFPALAVRLREIYGEILS